MHLIVLFAMFAAAWGLRYTWQASAQSWDRTLTIFLLPPLLLLTSAIAIVWMGPHGRMVWVGNDWFSYDLAISFLGFAGFHLCKSTYAGWKILDQVRTYPTQVLNNQAVRILDLPTLYSAQIGFWKPELIITQYSIDTLAPAHLTAIFAHEQAHHHYRDTWCFFWLGWLRQITQWLPQTAAIWQELLLLRELRADRWASTQVDPMLIAEALLLVVQDTSFFAEDYCAAFSQINPANRLTQRIDALLAIASATDSQPQSADSSQPQNLPSWLWPLVALLPLLAIPFHT